MRECVIVWWVVLGMAHGATLARNAADTLVATLVATPALFVSVTAIVIIGPRRTSAAASKEGINARLVRPVTFICRTKLEYRTKLGYCTKLDVIFIWYCTKLERAPSAAKHMSCFCASCDSRSSAGGLHAAFIESDSFEHDLHWARGRRSDDPRPETCKNSVKRTHVSHVSQEMRRVFTMHVSDVSNDTWPRG